MVILSVSKEEKEAVIRMNTDELVALCNMLYHETKDGKANKTVYKIYDTLMFAKDLSQYGQIDGFCLDSIIKCRNKISEIEKSNT